VLRERRSGILERVFDTMRRCPGRWR